MPLHQELLPDPPPADPFMIAAQWLAEATQRALQPNPNAMVLATATRDGQPSARVVLCKELVSDPGYLVFYTNYRSRKGRELAENSRAAAVMHWDHLHRQVRVEGMVAFSPPEESDAYFASRPRASRIGAWASAQSEVVGSRAELLAAVESMSRRFGNEGDIPRPPHWGGYRLWAQSIELWSEGEARIHDRLRWSRTLKPLGDGRFEIGAWQATRLQP
ncbi:MAG TPA: pyridoxamine 5'-phosphate oxidase [Steroidobacteraceae bacterium]